MADSQLDADLKAAKLRVRALHLWRRMVLKEKTNMTDVLICGSDDIEVDMGYPSTQERTTVPDGYWDKRAQDRERDTRTMQDLLDINSETLDATYRELAEARAALADCADRVHPDEHAAALAELDQLRRAWALRELAEPELLTDGALTYFPESVAALIRSGAGCPMGACDRCGQRAPLHTVHPGLHERDVCAHGWPCNEKVAT